MGEDDVMAEAPVEWQNGAMWLAGAAATIILALRIALGSETAEAVAISLLAGVIVFGLAYLANERRPSQG